MPGNRNGWQAVGGEDLDQEMMRYGGFGNNARNDIFGNNARNDGIAAAFQSIPPSEDNITTLMVCF